MEKIKSRNEIDEKYKWNTDPIYKNWDEWEKDVKEFTELIAEVPKYENKIANSREEFIEFIRLTEKVSRIAEKLYLYPYMLKDLDSTDQKVSKKLQEIEFLATEYSIATSWVSPKILEIPKEKMEKWLDEDDKIKDQKFGIMELYRLKSHVLDKDKEKLLSNFSQYMGAVNDIYDELSTSDIVWNEIELSTGEKVLVTNGAYSRILESNKNQDDRRKAFEALYGSYNVNKNTYAAIYKGILQRSAAVKRAKLYNSTLEKALEPNNIPVEVYENLVNSAKENSAPLKRYIEFRKNYLGLDSYHYYDNQIKLSNYEREFDYEEAKNIVLNSVKPLGEDYVKNLEKAISEGWLDVYETPNKRSGAYSLNIYDVHPYMLLNYNGTMDSVFTLAHELGHTLHSMYSTKYQPYATNDYTIFVAEVASTFNEKLLLDYMLKVTESHEEKIALIEEAIGNIMGTYYLQTLFADYEKKAHEVVEKGGPITPDVLSGFMAELFETYFGKTLVMDELQKIIWARIPHFFNSPYYVYQYATSFAASSRLYEKITNEKYTEKEREEARVKYIELLKSGGNDFPIEQLKKAGVNLLDKENFEAVSSEMDRLLDLLEEELKELNKNK